jgi:hypothetical protein
VTAPRAQRVFVVRLRAERGDEGIRGLRWTLKILWRRFGIRCLDLREEVEPAPTDVVRFPPRRSAAVIICKERDGDGWMVIAGAPGWLCGSLTQARAEARWLSDNLGLPVREAS